MKWLLVVLIAWADTPPLSFLQIAVETKELCHQAAEQVKEDLSASAAGESVGQPVGSALQAQGGIVTSCIRIADKR